MIKRLAIALFAAVIPLSNAEQSPFNLASDPYYPDKWLWEPASTLNPGSTGVDAGDKGPQGQELLWQDGGRALFTLSGNQWLRLYSAIHTESDPIPAIWSSRGNGLFTPVKPQRGLNEGEWIIAPQNTAPSLILIENISGERARWWLSTIVRDSLSDPYPYREPVFTPDLQPSWLFRRHRGEHLAMTNLARAQRYEIELEGPGSWRLEARVPFDPARGWQRFIEVPLQRNDSAWLDWRIHPRTDHETTYGNGICEVLLSYPESLYLSLPQGRHRIGFTAPQAMDVRLLRVDTKDFLLPRNQPSPSVSKLQRIIESDTGAVARLPYDEKLFKTLLNPTTPDVSLSRFANNPHPAMAAATAAAKLVDARYRFWRPLPVDGGKHPSVSTQLVDVVMADPRRGKKRYVASRATVGEKQDRLWQLSAGQAITLDAPGALTQLTVKLSLPVLDTSYELEIKTQRGETINWRWLPQLSSDKGFDVANSADLRILTSSPAQGEIATASASLTLAREDFPLQISHSADRDIWLSPFYRDVVNTSLARAGWESTVSELGEDRVLELLLHNAIPESGLTASEKTVRREWEPLIKWLSAYRQIWSRGLSGEPPTSSPYNGESLPLLIQKLEGTADYLLKGLLKTVVVKNSDPALQRQALDRLHKYYTQADDQANLNAYHSWHFQLSPNERLQPLADWLAISGMEDMAVRLYGLAHTPNTHLLYQLARLNAGWAQDDQRASIQEEVWTAVWRQDWKRAYLASERLPAGDPWRLFLANLPKDKDPVSWLQWARQSPAVSVNGNDATIATRIGATESAATLRFLSTGRDLHLQRNLATADTPASFAITGPVNLQLALNIIHPEDSSVLDDWVEIEVNGTRKWFPILESRVNKSIRPLSEHGAENVGQLQRVSLSLGSGRHVVKVRGTTHDLLVDAKIETGVLVSQLVHSLQFTSAASLPWTTSAKELTRDLLIERVPECIAETEVKETDAGHITAIKTPYMTDQSLAKLPLGKNWSARPALADTLPYRQPPSTGQRDEVEQYLLSLLWHWPQTPDEERRQLIGRANALAKPFVGNALIHKVLKKLNTGHAWQLEDVIVTSAGSRRIPLYTSTDNPGVAEREALLKAGHSWGAMRLAGKRNIGFFTRFIEETPVRVNIRQAHLPYEQTPPGRVMLSLNETDVATLSLPPQEQQISITVPAGEQHLRIRLDEPTSDHWIFIEAQARIAGQWQNLIEANQRRFHLATRQQPLTVYLAAPRWLRIDEYTEEGVSHRYTLQAEPGELNLYPPEPQSKALYRVYGWHQQKNSEELPQYVFNQQPDLTAMETAAEVSVPELATIPAPVYHWFPDSQINGSASSTDGLYLQFESRRDFDTDEGADDNERFGEVGWRHRQALDCRACFWGSDIFARHHTQDDIDLVGATQWLRGDIAQSSWRWETRHSLFVQSSPETEWSWSGLAGAVQKHDINEKIEHENELQVFARYLSAQTSDKPIDNDIYSQYKLQHQYGLKLSSTLRGRPWLDSLWSVNAGLASNEDFNPFEPDYVQTTLAWRQYFRPLALSAVYRHRYYLSDNDRARSAHRPQLGLSLNSMSGLFGKRILAWGVSVDYDLDRGEYGFALNLSFDNPRGRALQDFDPGRLSFYSLRDRDLGSDLHRHNMLSGQTHDDE